MKLNVFCKILFILGIAVESFSYTLPLQNKQKNTRIRMSMSEKYLNHLQKNNVVPIAPISNEAVSEMIKTVPIVNKSSIEIENIYLNIYKMSSLFFNRKAQNIYFTPARELTELYYYDDKQLYKIPENTTIVSKNLRNFVITEMNDNIDGVLF